MGWNSLWIGGSSFSAFRGGGKVRFSYFFSFSKLDRSLGLYFSLFLAFTSCFTIFFFFFSGE
jgi:hypothetical protein